MPSEKEAQLILPVPTNIDPAVFSSLTPSRQWILIYLLKKGEQTFTSLLGDTKIQSSTLSESLKMMEEKKLVCKGEQKGYCLTNDGKLLALMLMQPNGVKIEEIHETLDNLLKTEFKIIDSSMRKELVEDLKQKGDFIAMEQKENAN